METTKKQLGRAESELATGRKVLSKEKKKVKNLKKRKSDRLHKENAKRALKTIEKGVKALKEHRDILSEQAEEESGGDE